MLLVVSFRKAVLSEKSLYQKMELVVNLLFRRSRSFSSPTPITTDSDPKLLPLRFSLCMRHDIFQRDTNCKYSPSPHPHRKPRNSKVVTWRHHGNERGRLLIKDIHALKRIWTIENFLPSSIAWLLPICEVDEKCSSRSVVLALTTLTLIPSQQNLRPFMLMDRPRGEMKPKLTRLLDVHIHVRGRIKSYIHSHDSSYKKPLIPSIQLQWANVTTFRRDSLNSVWYYLLCCGEHRKPDGAYLSLARGPLLVH